MRRWFGPIFGGSLALVGLAVLALASSGLAADDTAGTGRLGVAVDADPPYEGQDFRIKILEGSVAAADVGTAPVPRLERAGDGFRMTRRLMPGRKTVALTELPPDYRARSVTCRTEAGEVVASTAGPDLGSVGRGSTAGGIDIVDVDPFADDGPDIGAIAAGLVVDSSIVEVDLLPDAFVTCTFSVDTAPTSFLYMGVDADPPYPDEDFLIKTFEGSVAATDLETTAGFELERAGDDLHRAESFSPGRRTIALTELPSDYRVRGVTCQTSFGEVLASTVQELGRAGRGTTDITVSDTETLPDEGPGLGAAVDDLLVAPNIIEFVLPAGVNYCTFSVDTVEHPWSGLVLVGMEVDPPDPDSDFVMRILEGSVAAADLATTEGYRYESTGDAPSDGDFFAAGRKTVALTELPSFYRVRSVTCSTSGGEVVASSIWELGRAGRGATTDITDSDTETLPDEGPESGAITDDLLAGASIIEFDQQPDTGADIIECTFSVESAETDEAGKTKSRIPLAGKWKAINHAGRFECAGIRTAIAQTTQNGRLEVKGGGQRLIAIGLAEDRKARVVLDADPAKAERWRGKLKARQQGQSVTLSYSVDLVTPRKMRGTIKADFKVAGRSCQMARDVTLTRRGK